MLEEVEEFNMDKVRENKTKGWGILA